jgi:SAM-dependent MidA family methyltransferase
MQLVEAGAHQGQLARDILEWLRRFRPEILKNLEYWIIEPSPQRTAWQKRALNDFRANVRWAAGIPELAEALPAGVRGVIFSNELLDAMPVHRFGWDAVGQEWFEWGVALEDEQFKWRRMPFAESAFSGSVLAVLPDNFSTEVGSDALAWWREAARVLSEGRLLTIDYGLPAESFYAPERAEGTLRGYFQHRLVTDVLARPGSQDITAEVNFTAIQRAGEDAGLKTETLASQSQFLTSIAASEETGVGEWTAKQLRQFQSLTHPEHLGRAFHVLIQSRGADACNS